MADHALSATALLLGTAVFSVFDVADDALQDLPDQPADAVGNRPDCALVAQARQQAPKQGCTTRK